MFTPLQFAAEMKSAELVGIVPGLRRGWAVEPVIRLPCAVPALDELLGGGWPRGRLSEIYGARSAGKTTLALHLLASVTQRGETGVWVDAADALHPLSLVAAGVDLRRVLWVRPRSGQEALRCAEIVLSNKGFALVVLDWGERAPHLLGHAAWVRLQRAAARAHAVLLVLTPRSLAGSFAALRVHMQRRGTHWLRVGQRACLEGLQAIVAVERNRTGPERQQLRWQASWQQPGWACGGG